MTRLPRGQLHATLGKVAGADLRPREVGEHGHLLADLVRGGPHRGEALQVLLHVAVAEVQPDHVDTCHEQVAQDVGLVACRAECRDDLRPAAHI